MNSTLHSARNRKKNPNSKFQAPENIQILTFKNFTEGNEANEGGNIELDLTADCAEPEGWEKLWNFRLEW